MDINYNNYTFFWKSKSPFSQWYPSLFVLDGKEFNSAEKYMMYRKAMLFGDIAKAKEILAVSNPADAKKKGREVKGFSAGLWELNCKLIVYKGNHAKFTQNPVLLKVLMGTGDTDLCEASPFDSIWGLGLDEAAARKTPPDQWPGTNFLGEILTKLRNDLKTKIIA